MPCFCSHGTLLHFSRSAFKVFNPGEPEQNGELARSLRPAVPEHSGKLAGSLGLPEPNTMADDCQIQLQGTTSQEFQTIFQRARKTECPMECHVKCQIIGQIECQVKCQIDCQIVGRIECRVVCQIEC
jgi:hypothetical protein